MTFKPWMWWGFGIVASVLIFANWHDSKSDDLQKNDEDELRSKLMREFDDKERDN